MAIFGEIGNPVPWIGTLYREEPEGYIISGSSLSPVFRDAGIGVSPPDEPLDPAESIHDGGVTGLDGPADIYWQQRTGVTRYLKRELLRVWDSPTIDSDLWEDFRTTFEQPVITSFPAAPAKPRPRRQSKKPPGGMWIKPIISSLLEIERNDVVVILGTKAGGINVEANDDATITGGDSSVSVEQDDVVKV